MSRNKARGTAFERLVADYCALWYPDADRRALQGTADKGDILLPGERRFVIECKDVARLSLAEWHAEACAEAVNAGAKHGVVVHKRKGKGQAADQWASMSLHTFLELVTHGT